MPCVHKHEQQRYNNEKTKKCLYTICMLYTFPLTKAIPIMFERVITHYQTLHAWIGHNAVTHYRTFSLS